MNRILFLLLVILASSCKPATQFHKVTGATMGTYYMVTYEGTNPQKTQKEIDKLLIEFNNSLSTYIPSSFISKLNKSESGIELPSEEIYFVPVLNRSKELFELTEGRLNCSVMPLIRYWRDNSTAIDTNKISVTHTIVKNSSFAIKDTDSGIRITKSPSLAELDFSSLAKGYGIDIIAKYFEKQKIDNYLVDIGGEARANGKNSIGQTWTLAINKPKEGSGLTEVELILQLDNKSIATSGTYRQFYQKDGKKIAHIVDPISGLSIESDLLSASIIADDCMTADGLATAMMVYNLEGAKAFLEKNKYPACLIYDEDGDEKLEKFYANGFEKYVLQFE